MKHVPENTDQLIRMLCETMHEVRYGHMPIQQGLAVSKIAAQISNIAQAEVSIARVLLELGEKANTFGNMPLGALSAKALAEESKKVSTRS